MIFYYVRNEKRERIGVVVATNPNEIGWSLMKRQRGFVDDLPSKNLAFVIATCKAVKGSRVEPPFAFLPYIEKMKVRARKYFRAPVFGTEANKPVFGVVSETNVK